jgi:hypothetical protein
MKAWPELAELYKDSNREQAAHVPIKLAAVNCDMVPVDPAVGAATFEFTADEINVLAQMEHERWMLERRPKQPEHPDLVPWERLPADEQAKDVSAVRALPGMLERVGLRIVRLSG